MPLSILHRHYGTIYPYSVDLFKPWPHSNLTLKLISSLSHISEYPLPPSDRPRLRFEPVIDYCVACARYKCLLLIDID